MRPLSFLLAGAAMFVAALTVNAATVCQGKILNPVTDVCWSCVFPVKIGGKASLTTSVLPDPDTGAGGPFCTCGKGLNLRAGVTFSFWEPLRTAEIVRHAGCLPSMGGVNMGDMGLRISDHVKVHSHEPDGSMKRHTDFRQVHWYATPWLFILEALLDEGCLDQQTFDLAYMSELDPLWDDTLSSFILNPDAALFANPIAQGACAADCTSASSGLPQNSLYWCSGCQGNVFPLTGWSASLTSHTAVWQLMTHRFAMKLSREGLLLAAHGSKGLCESFYEPLMRKDVWRTQLVWPAHSGKNTDGSCCSPLGRTTVVSGSGKSWSPGGEDGVVLVWRRRDCCSISAKWGGGARQHPAFKSFAGIHKPKTHRKTMEILMKHESNDTPPFAPDDPISRSLFVRPSLIERLCASALRLCLLVCIPAAASVFLISLADSAEAACTSEPSQHYEVTTLIADHPVQTSSDPDFEEILKANARIAVESGEWSRRVKRKEETLIQWMRSPVFPEFRPMAVKTTLIRRPTGLSVEDIRRAELFNDVSRLLLFFDSRAGGQVNFAMRMLSTASFAIRPVVAAGSVAFAQEKLGMRVWADQGSVLTRRLGLNHWPALVKLTPSEISVWTPALNADGIPDSPVPAGLASKESIDLSAPAVRPATTKTLR